MSHDADEILGRMRADGESDWPTRLLGDLADAALVDESALTVPCVARTDRDGLSPGRARVLQAASSGLTNRMIADVLGVSIETVKTQMRQAILALGAKDRTHACCIAIRQGLIP